MIDWANSRLDIETAVASLVIAMQNSPAGTQMSEIISAANAFFPILSAPAVVSVTVSLDNADSEVETEEFKKYKKEKSKEVL